MENIQIEYNNFFQEDQNNKNWMKFVEYPLGIISIFSSFFVIFVYIFYKKLRCFAFEIVVYLTIASIINTTSYLINFLDQDNDDFKHIIPPEQIRLCKFQAFLIIWFEFSQMIWITLITFSIYESVILFDNVDGHKKTSHIKRFTYLFIGYVLPLVFSFIGLWSDYLGPCGRWCWVVLITDMGGKIFGITLNALLWLLILINVLLSCYVIKFVKRITNVNIGLKSASKTTRKLLAYPIIQIITLIPVTINRIYYIVTKRFSVSFELFSIIFLTSQGLCYAITYGYNPQVRQAIKDSINTIFCCKKKEPEMIRSFSSHLSNESKNDDFILDNHNYSHQ